MRDPQHSPGGLVNRIRCFALVLLAATTFELAYDAPFNDRLVGLYKTPEAGVEYAYTQFEAIDARWAFPCFDEPLFKTPFDVTLTVPAADVAVSNTKLVEETRAAD